MKVSEILLAVFLLMLPGLLSGQPVRISGSGKGYGGAELRFYEQSDPITKREKPLFRISCDDSSSFSCEVPVSGSNLIFIKAGIFSMQLHVVQGKDYEIRMPDYVPLPGGEDNNPFYIKTMVIPVVTNDTSDINNFIRRFDSEYNPVFNMVADRIALNYRVSEINQEISRLNSTASLAKDAFSTGFAQFRLIMLNNVASGNYSGRLEDSALINRSFLPGNQAYLDLIEQKFTGYFRNLAAGSSGNDFLKAFYSSSLNDLRKLVSAGSRVSDPQLLDYIIIMNLYSEFYSGSLGQGLVLRMLDLLKTGGASGYIKELAVKVTEDIVSLLPGNIAPYFSLSDISGQSFNPGSFRGKFILLSLARADLAPVLLEYGILKMWYTKYSKDLQLVTILRDRSFAEAAQKMGDNGFKWISLDGSGEDMLDYKYNVRMYPSFILIDREGKIVNSSCPMPSENLEAYIRSILERGGMPLIP